MTENLKDINLEHSFNNSVNGSPIPLKAKKLLEEGKITTKEYNSLLESDKIFYEDEEIENIPWIRISKDTIDVTGPLIVIEEQINQEIQYDHNNNDITTNNHQNNNSHTKINSEVNNLQQSQYQQSQSQLYEREEQHPNRRRLEAERRAVHTRTKIETQKQKESLKRHETIAKTTEKWENRILPKWNDLKKTNEVAKLVTQGIPTKYRGRVWFAMIGNSLQIEEYQYHGLVNAAKDLTEKARKTKLLKEEEERQGLEPGSLSPIEPSIPEEGGDRQSTMMLIEWDLPRTFPTLRFFHDGGPLHESLDRVLKAYACYRPDIGYVQGMSYMVAVFLLNMDEFEAFVCLANLLSNKRTNMDIYLLNRPAITAYIKCFDHFFAQYLPLLYSHFTNEGIPSETFLLDWYLTVFSKALPLEVAARMWDCYLFTGEVFILRGSLGLLRLFAARLASLSMEKILPFLAHVPEEAINADELMDNIQQIKITPQKYDNIRQQFNYHPTNSARNEEILKKSVISNINLLNSSSHGNSNNNNLGNNINHSSNNNSNNNNNNNNNNDSSVVSSLKNNQQARDGQCILS